MGNSLGRPASIGAGRVRRCNKCETGPPPVYATRPTMPAGTGIDLDTVQLRKEGVTLCNLERSGDGAAAENEKPRLPFRFQIPGGICRQIDALKYEVRAGNKQPPFGGKLVRTHFKISRPGVRHPDGVFDVKFALPARIE